MDGELYAVGGWEGNYHLDSCERYDPATNTWTLIAPMKTTITSTAVTSYNGCLYVAGQFHLEFTVVREFSYS